MKGTNGAATMVASLARLEVLGRARRGSARDPHRSACLPTDVDMPGLDVSVLACFTGPLPNGVLIPGRAHTAVGGYTPQLGAVGGRAWDRSNCTAMHSGSGRTDGQSGRRASFHVRGLDARCLG